MHTSSTLTSFHISNHYRFVDIFRCTIPFKKTFRNTRIYSPSCAKKTYHCIEVFVWSFCKNTFLHYFFFFLLSNMMCILCVRWYLLSPITPLKYLTGPKEKRLDTNTTRALLSTTYKVNDDFLTFKNCTFSISIIMWNFRFGDGTDVFRQQGHSRCIWSGEGEKWRGKKLRGILITFNL